MKKYRMIILIALSSFATGCIKEHPCTATIQGVDGYAKSLFFNYNNGSYWIYQDSLGNIDSSWISYSGCDPVTPGCYERCAINLSSSVAYNDFSIDADARVFSILSIYNNPYGYSEECFRFKFLGNSINTMDTTSTVFIPLSNYQVNQFYFPQAVKFVSNGCRAISYITVVPSIGIVEKKQEMALYIN